MKRHTAVFITNTVDINIIQPESIGMMLTFCWETHSKHFVEVTYSVTKLRDNWGRGDYCIFMQ